MQDSTKEGSGGGDRRNWRERLGVGQDLPKISDEFRPSQDDAKPDQEPEARAPEEAQAEPASDAKPSQDERLPGKAGTPVRPAPMAPRLSRPAARPDDISSGSEVPTSKSGEAKRLDPTPPAPGPLDSPAQPANNPAEALREQRPMGQAARPGASQPQGPASTAARPVYSPRMSPPPASQRPAPPTRGPAANVQLGRSGTAPSAAGSGSFSERLRAQREAAERLAQQRLAAARDRSAHSGADAKTGLDPRKVEPARPAGSRSGPNAGAKPAGAEQPRFTFAKEEIVAAQREAGPHPEGQLADGQAQPGEARGRMPPPHVPPHSAAGEYRPGASFQVGEAAGRDPDPGYVAATPDYRHEDDGMFEDEQPQFQAAPARASAADYSAAYREFEDEFEEEPRRGGGPLLVLLSLLAVAVISGGVIYWYQQVQRSPTPDAADLPVIMAPEDSAKADPEPLQQPQAAVQPPRRKQIYDRILGQETLEPERIVPTEEEPQLRQVQQPQTQQPRSAGEGQSDSPGAQQDQSTEPLPLPLPPPPGTGEQGDLLVPGMADTVMAASAPEPAQLVLPDPVAEAALASDPADRRASREATVRSPARETPPPSPQTTQRADPRDAATASASEAPATQPIYPDPTVPLPYSAPMAPPAHPGVAAESPAQAQTAEPVEATTAALPEPEPEAEAEPNVEQASDVPLPRTKPEPPLGVRTVTRSAPQAQPQRQRSAPQQSSGSGPMQITPTVLAPDRTPATQQPQALQPETEQPATAPSPPPAARSTIGRDDDPLAGHRLPFSGSPVTDSAPAARQLASTPQPAPQAAQQQVASVAPEAVRSQSETAGGYVVQLASFRSESEALNEYQRLVQRHPHLVGGLKSRVQQASLGQSGTFYRLGVGPLADRTAATKLCNDLIAAGEKDCLVRRN